MSAVVAGPDMATRALVRLDGVCRAFSGRTVLRGVSFEIAAGEFVALLGRSGSGKSTLLRAVAELDDDAEASGAIVVPRDVSVLFQDSRLLPWLDVLGNVTLGLKGSEVGARGRRALDDVGLGGRASSWPAILSGGEQQRVALARSLVRDPRLLLADEPFGALDALTRGRMQALLSEVAAARGPAVLLVTHDIDEALLLADRVLVMEDGRIVADRPVDLARPRRGADPGFARLRADLLARIGAAATA